MSPLLQGILDLETPGVGRLSIYTKQWTGVEYDRAVEANVFRDERVELIDGEIIVMSPKNDPHAAAIRLCNATLLRVFPPDRYTVQIQSPLRLGEKSRPEPDLCVLSGPAREHLTHPTGGLLIVEVAEATVDLDRRVKSKLYAAAGVLDYWIVNLRNRQLEVYRNPRPIADGTWSYDPPTVVRPGESIAPLAMATATVAAADLLP